MLLAVQLATVSSAFRFAAKLALKVITEEEDLRLDEAAVSLPSRMDSKLLLDWAMHSMVRLRLSPLACAVPGMARFVKASQGPEAPAAGVRSGSADLCTSRVSCELLLQPQDFDLPGNLCSPPHSCNFDGP